MWDIEVEYFVPNAPLNPDAFVIMNSVEPNYTRPFHFPPYCKIGKGLTVALHSSKSRNSTYIQQEHLQ